MKWIKKHIVTETLYVGKKKQINFVPIDELPLIASLSSSCGCSTPKLVDNQIVVIFTPGSIPSHLTQLGQYKQTGKIYITYRDNTQDTLSFTALVKRKEK